MTDQEILIERLRMAIKRSGKSHDVIAGEARIGKGAISNITRCHDPSSYTIRALCRVLGTSADWLLNLKDDTSPSGLRKWEAGILQKTLDKFGIEHQISQLTGEIGELLDAMHKYRDGRDTAEHIGEEIVDVQIMLEQMLLHFDVKGLAKEIRREKLERLGERIKDR